MSRRRGTSQHQPSSSVDRLAFYGTIPREQYTPKVRGDFHAQWPGICGLCKERYEAGAVIVRSLRGYLHSPLCPKDRAPEEGGDA